MDIKKALNWLTSPLGDNMSDSVEVRMIGGSEDTGKKFHVHGHEIDAGAKYALIPPGAKVNGFDKIPVIKFNGKDWDTTHTTMNNILWR